jgi:type I restriction enzyme M protein
MAKKRKNHDDEELQDVAPEIGDDAAEDDDGGGEDVTSIEDGKILDYITGDPIKDSPKEAVRQRIARALFHEYGISPDDMERDFKVKVEGGNKAVDIAIFDHGKPHKLEHLRRVILCRPEPKSGKKTVQKIRDHEQAAKDLRELEEIMAAVEHSKYGLWTNGLEFFYVEKQESRFDTKFIPVGDMPMADETLGSREVASHATMRRADPAMLRTSFRRCHNFIHGNEGMPKDAAFWQFLYLIFAKMYDERHHRNGSRQFWVGTGEQFDPEGRKRVRLRILPLFEKVKASYPNIFRGNEEITLSDRAMAFMVAELARYDFVRTDVDAKGAAYQEIVGANLRGDRGQYFTPRGAIKLMVDMLDPKENERVMDCCSGTGGFLSATLDYLLKKFKEEDKVSSDDENSTAFISVHKRLGDWASKNLFGADFDQFLVRAAQMNVIMACNQEARIYHMNSLEFPNGHLSGVQDAKNDRAWLGTMDVVMTNPPFGSDIPVTEPQILREYELAHYWTKGEDGTFRMTERVMGSVAPEILFIERCVQWLKPGGRMGIVLPDGVLGNPGDEYIRAWILRNCWVLASVDLPVESFIVEANVNILTSLLFLKKKTEQEIKAEDLGKPKEYPVFMAVAERVGFDRRGNILYKRSPDGEELVQEEEERERIRLGGESVYRTVRRKKKIVDDDLPLIAEEYRKFQEVHAGELP